MSLLCAMVSTLVGLDPTISQGAHPFSRASLEKGVFVKSCG